MNEELRQAIADAEAHMASGAPMVTLDDVIGYCVCDDGPDRPASDCGIPSHRAEGRSQRGKS